MPLCQFRPRESPDALGILGWIPPNTGVVHVLEGTLAELLRMDPDERNARLERARRASGATLPLGDVLLLAPVDEQEVWAAGVTYERSRDARMEESSEEDVYDRVYDAERPELFFKAPAWRCVGDAEPIAIRHDSIWDVPEPELALVIDAHGHVFGYTIGNDVSSRSIEGENPLYLPQAKIFTRSCALGPWITLPAEIGDPYSLRVLLTIERRGKTYWEGETTTANLHRSPDDLVRWLYAALDFPSGAVLLTGTGIVPPSEFTLESGDLVTITIEGLGRLSNQVHRLAPPTR